MALHTCASYLQGRKTCSQSQNAHPTASLFLSYPNPDTVREAGKIHAPLDDKKKLGGDKQDGNGDGKGYSLTASTLGGTKPAVSVSGDL
eukprot:1334879-Amorphochlora_amoeboformis.AAC.3